MNVFEWLKSLVKKKEEMEVEVNAPPEYVLIDYNPEAKIRGLTGNENKIIYYVKQGEDTREFIYSPAILKGITTMRKIPYLDISEEEEEKKDIIEEIRPDLLEY